MRRGAFLVQISPWTGACTCEATLAFALIWRGFSQGRDGFVTAQMELNPIGTATMRPRASPSNTGTEGAFRCRPGVIR